MGRVKKSQGEKSEELKQDKKIIKSREDSSLVEDEVNWGKRREIWSQWIVDSRQQKRVIKGIKESN